VLEPLDNVLTSLPNCLWSLGFWNQIFCAALIFCVLHAPYILLYFVFHPNNIWRRIQIIVSIQIITDFKYQCVWCVRCLHATC